MLDIGWSEMAVIALLALVIIGPKDLPRVMRSVGQWMRKARSIAREFQSGLDDMMRETELDEARKTVERTSRFDVGREVERHVDPTGSVRENARDLEQEARSDGGSSDSGSAGADYRHQSTPTAPAHSVNAGKSADDGGGHAASDTNGKEPAGPGSTASASGSSS